MLMKQIIDAYEVLDSSFVTGEAVKEYLLGIKADANVEVYELVGPKGSTDMLKVRIPGKNGKTNGGDAPTIGLLGRLGGIGARPERIGFVSDGDGALCAVALAAKLLDMQNKGDYLDGDVFISTHICPHAPTAPHDPVPFMGSPVEMAQVNKEEVSPDLDALLSSICFGNFQHKSCSLFNISSMCCSCSTSRNHSFCCDRNTYNWCICCCTWLQDLCWKLPKHMEESSAASMMQMNMHVFRNCMEA